MLDACNFVQHDSNSLEGQTIVLVQQTHNTQENPTTSSKTCYGTPPRVVVVNFEGLQPLFQLQVRGWGDSRVALDGMLCSGYHILFHHQPPTTQKPQEFPSHGLELVKTQVLQAKLHTMLSKGALEIVSGKTPSFYNRIFMAKKASVGWTLVIDLSPLNGFDQLTKCKMETIASVLAYLQFSIKVTTYQFQALCISFLSAHQVFTRVFILVLTWAYHRGICLHRHLDNWLVISDSLPLLVQPCQLLQFCKDLEHH